MATVKKSQTVADLRALDEKALTDKVSEYRRELVEHYRSNAAGEIASVAVISKTRKSIAKALTVLTEKQRAAAQKEEK
jgi:ribosomal protein L29